ncbi:hypothetical protein Tco_0950470 [Tanacetum coccineum]
MHGLWKTVIELHTMLKLHEETIPNKEAAPVLHTIRAGRIQKNNKNKKPLKAAKGKDQRKGKTKLFYAPKSKITPPTKKDSPDKDAIFHQCGEVYDIGCATHICNTTQGLRGSKKLKLGALNLYVGNGQRGAVEAIGSFHLCLPSGLVIVLDTCHYDPSITRGILSVSHLYDNGHLPLPPLPTRTPVPPPNDSAVGRLALWVLILGGIIYTRENIGNVR